VAHCRYASDGDSTWEAFSAATTVAGELMIGSINDSNSIAVVKHVFSGSGAVGVLANGNVQLVSPTVRSAGLPAINHPGDIAYLVERSTDWFSIEVYHPNAMVTPLWTAGPGHAFRHLSDVGIADKADVAVQASNA
jgi:hypothetical protein